MSLYKYQKNTKYKEIDLSKKHKAYISDNSYNKITLSSLFNDFNNTLKSSRIARIVFPSAFILIGLFFIYQEVFPQIQQYIQQSNGYYNLGNLSPVDIDYIDLSKYISHPKNLSLLANSAINEHILQPDETSKNFKGTFYISIPSIGINHLPVQANVNSTSEEIYNQVLNYSLAHFANTGLPISNIKNNMVIYGHSASTTYNPKPSDPMVAFSFLPELKVGDQIIIEIEGKTFKYQMYKSMIVQPDDTSIITGTGKGTLTLFTCFPLGSDAQRYTAVARPVN